MPFRNLFCHTHGFSLITMAKKKLRDHGQQQLCLKYLEEFYVQSHVDPSIIP